MANQEQVDAMRQAAQAIIGFDVESLLVRPVWGTVNFKDIAREMWILKSLSHSLVELPVEYITQDQAQKIIHAARQGVGAVQGVDRFELPQMGQLDTLKNSVRQAAEGLTFHFHPWIGFLAYQKGDIQAQASQLSTALGQARQMITDSQKFVDDTKGKIESLSGAAQDAAAKVAVGHFSQEFGDQADKLDETAEKWLTGTAWLAGITLVVALVAALIPIKADTPASEIAHLISSKIIVVAVLLSATVWCGRMYKATKHQAATNHHRASALKTFSAFVAATNDEDIKNAVLLETTRSIFAIAPSGYLETSDSALEPASKVMEIVRSSKGPG